MSDSFPSLKRLSAEVPLRNLVVFKFVTGIIRLLVPRLRRSCKTWMTITRVHNLVARVSSRTFFMKMFEPTRKWFFKCVYNIAGEFNCASVPNSYVHADDVAEGISLTQYLNYRIENVIKQLVHASAVRSSRYEALGKFGEHSRS